MKNQNTVDIAGIGVSRLKRPREPPEQEERMELFEILADVPKDEIIGDNIVRAYAKINSPIYKKIICTVSGGYDSDIVIDICTKCDKEKKIEYVWFNTGLEYKATKDHLKELESIYGIEIKERRAKSRFRSHVRNTVSRSCQKRFRST